MRQMLIVLLVVGAAASSCGGAEVDGAALSEPGPHGVGRVTLDIVDESRDARAVGVTAFYPAISEESRPDPDAEPEAADAPYPIVLGDSKIGDLLGPHLASHGYVFLSVRPPIKDWPWWPNAEKLIDMPLDLMAALDDLHYNGDHPLHDLADPTRVGVIGYSFGSVLALGLSGARYDPAYYEATCAARPDGWSDNWWTFVCGQPEGWDHVRQRADELGLEEADGRWRALGDERIKAVMPMGPEGFELYGPGGLAEATAEALFIAAGSDTINDYVPATTDLFEHYPDAELITFVGADHMMIFQPDVVDQIQRFAVAFFALQLGAEEGYAELLTTEFVEDEAPGLGKASSFETLLWGVHDG